MSGERRLFDPRLSLYRSALATSGILSLAALVWPRCRTCSHAAVSFASVPLEHVGLTFYSVLAIVSFTRVRDRFVDFLYAALGFHAWLITEMVRDGRTCFICICVALCCVTAAVCGARHSVGVVVAALAFFIGVLSARYLVSPIVAEDLAKHPRLITVLANIDAPKSRALTVYVFGRDGCPVCAEFWAKDAGRLQTDFQSNLKLVKVDVNDEHLPLPTFVIYSRYHTPKVVFGMPRVEDINSYLHSLEYWRPNQGPSRTF